MKNNKPLKTLTWKYGTVKIFIWIIVFLIVMCLAGAWIFYICNKEFGYSALLNVSGGLFTGLILLSYQYLSNQNLNTANMIVTQLELIDIIPVQYIDIIDFCSDYNLVPQDELDTINIEEILKDNEGAAYALDTCTKAIQKAENQFNNIKEFSNTVLIIPLDFLGYEKALAEIKRFFSVYSQEVQYAMPPYFLREHHEFNDAQAEDFDDILKSFENEEEMEAYLKENPSIQQNPSYYRSSG